MTVTCPCCRRRADLRPEALALALDLPPQQEAILRALWRGKGQPVQNTNIIREMYRWADEQPEDTYRAFKVALHHLRRKLRRTVFRIENAGYACGYRLIRDQQAGGATFRAELATAGAEWRAA